ncbi:MAG: tetratricopeptide repeat protein [Fidelibacterota bacterium]
MSKTELEDYFADRLDTSLYPFLAEAYLSAGDVSRARKVCQIGLKQHPDDGDGWYLLARIARAEDDLINAEKCLKEAIDCGRSHVRARRELAEIQTLLHRSPNTIISAWKRVLRLIPDHPEAVAEIERLQTKLKKADGETKDSVQSKQIEKPKKKKTVTGKTTSSAAGRPVTTPVSPRMATLTLAQVYKDQGLYQHALDVLILLEKKGVNPEAVAEEKQIVERLLQQSLEENNS